MNAIPVTKPCFGPEEHAAIGEVLASGWVTQGPQVEAFEAKVAEFTGAQHAVAVTSCTTALQLVLRAYDIGPASEVIVPSHTYIATVNAIMLAGARPVFADIRPDTYTIDPNQIVDRITPRTKAIMPVHLGLPADLDEIYELADTFGLRVIEDAAQGLGAAYRGRMVGNARDAACFSFHPRKVITTGEGGAVATNDARLATELRKLRHHYMTVSDTARHTADRVVVEEYEDIGLNARMSDVHAAIGVVQMNRIEHLLARRRELAARYDEFLRANVSWLTPPSCPPDRSHSYVSYVARLSPDAPIARDDLMQALLARGVATRPGVMCAHLQPAYRRRCRGVWLPESIAATAETVILPLYPQMTAAEQALVCESLTQIAAERSETLLVRR